MIALVLALAAAPQQDLKCPPKLPGFLAGPMVRDEDTAREVFSAVTAQFMGGADWTGMTVQIIGGAGDRNWIVYHDRGSPKRRGGGGMAMTIDRCTGAVSKLHYQR